MTMVCAQYVQYRTCSSKSVIRYTHYDGLCDQGDFHEVIPIITQTSLYTHDLVSKSGKQPTTSPTEDAENNPKIVM